MSKPRELQIINWNVLNDYFVPRHDQQADRAQGIADEIRKVWNGGPVVIYLNELSSDTMLDTIRELIGSPELTASKSYQYTHRNRMGFITNLKDAKVSSLNSDAAHKKQRSAILQSGNISVVGTHLPYRIMRDRYARRRVTSAVLEKVATLDNPIICGDFNCTAVQAPRRRIQRAGFKNAIRGRLPAFPAPFFRGKNIPVFTPRLPIDAIYLGKNYDLKSVSAAHTEVSDHPLLSATVEIS